MLDYNWGYDRIKSLAKSLYYANFIWDKRRLHLLYFKYFYVFTIKLKKARKQKATKKFPGMKACA